MSESKELWAAWWGLDDLDADAIVGPEDEVRKHVERWLVGADEEDTRFYIGRVIPVQTARPGAVWEDV